MKKRKILCLFLSLAVVVSCLPFFTVQADAFSTGSTTLLKTRTITIKPGKTYKTPYIRLRKSMTFQVPLEIWLSKKDTKKPAYIKKGGYKLMLKNSKGKLLASYSHSLKYADKHKDYWYSDWIYFYRKSISKSNFYKGKYYFTIKNTTSRTITVKYSVKGYTKYATKADFPEEVTINNGETKYIGRVGPGLPVLKGMSVNSDVVEVDWYITADGRLYITAYGDEKDTENILTITLKKNSVKYKIKLNVKGYDSEDSEPADPAST